MQQGITELPLMMVMLLHTTILLLLVLLLLPSPICGFAAWLKCNRELEEDEIIMNNKLVRHHADSGNEGSVVKLAVYDDSGSTRVDVASSDNDGSAVVWIDDDMSRATYIIGLDETTTSDLSDIQFVVETTPFHTSPSPRPAPTPNVPTTTKVTPQRKVNKTSFTGASTGGGILCGGRRAHARRLNGNVTYKLVAKKKGSGKDSSVIAEVWGGWSQYHGPVTLTPRITFKRKDSAAAAAASDVGEEDAIKEDAPDHHGEL